MFALYVGHERQKKNDITVAVLYWHGGNYVDFKINIMKKETAIKLTMGVFIAYLGIIFFIPIDQFQMFVLTLGFQMFLFSFSTIVYHKDMEYLEELKTHESSIAFLRKINAEKMEELERLDDILLNPSKFNSKIHDDLKERREMILSELNENDRSIKAIENKIKSFVKKKYNG